MFFYLKNTEASQWTFPGNKIWDTALLTFPGICWVDCSICSGDMGTTMYFNVVAINSDIVNVVCRNIYIYTMILYDKYLYSGLQGVYIYIMDTDDVTS